MAFTVPVDLKALIGRSASWGNCVVTNRPTRSASMSTSSSCIFIRAEQSSGLNSSWLGADREQVCAQTDQRLLRLDGSRRQQHLFAPVRVRPVLLHEPARTFDSEQRHRVEACVPDFINELLGSVEVGGGEPLGVAGRVGVSMLAIDKVAFGDRAKERVTEPPPPQPVQESRKARDTDGCDNATGLQNSQGLEQRGSALRLLSEVVQRAEQDNGVGRGVRLGNRTGISHLRGEAMFGLGIVRLLRLLDVKLQHLTSSRP